MYECTPPKNLIVVYVSLWLAGVFSPLLYTSVTTILPSIAREFHVSAASISLVVMFFAFSQALFSTIGGRLGDMFGLRRMMSLGFAFCAITLVGLYFANSFLLIAFFRLVQGIGTAFIVGSSIAIAVNITPVEKRGMIFGVMSSAMYFATSIGPLVGGGLATFFGWREVFLALGILCVAIWVMFLLSLRNEWCTVDNETFDTKGAILLSISLGCITFGASFMNYHSSLIALLVAGVVLLIVFVKLQLKTEFPVVNIRLFIHSQGFALGLLAMLINFGSIQSIVYLSTLFFQQVQHYTPLHAGMFMLCQTITQFLFSPLIGKYADKHLPEHLIVIGVGIITACLVAVSYFTPDTSIYIFCAVLVCTGVGLGVFSAPIMISTLRNIPQANIGSASGLTSTARSIGVLCTQVLISFILIYFMGDATITDETVPLFLTSMHVALMSLAVINILCMLAYVMFARKISRQQKEEKSL